MTALPPAEGFAGPNNGYQQHPAQGYMPQQGYGSQPTFSTMQGGMPSYMPQQMPMQQPQGYVKGKP